ncbi:MAG: DUF4312 family protein [Erysipelotrichaceae bacterium]|nr:DUF4312 family protein [Erysipelotrichaceae bacterium]MBQ6494347.1 DUF4312 family protein [Erysipelotrichaceae bacterium]
MAENKSSLKKMEKAVEIEAYGKNRKEAIGTAFGKIKNESYAAVGENEVLVDVHAVDVYILEEEEKTKIQKLFGFFMPREVQDYRVKLKIILEIKYL